MPLICLVFYTWCCIWLLSSFMFDVYIQTSLWKYTPNSSMNHWVLWGICQTTSCRLVSLLSHTDTHTEASNLMNRWYLDCDWQIQNMGLSLLFSHLQEQDLNGMLLVSRNLLPALSNDTLWPLNRPMTVRHWQAALQTSSQQNQ